MQASKQIKQGKVDIDYDDCALVVHYEIETVYRDENGWPVEVNRDDNVKADSKRIKLRNLAVESNLPQLAADIVVSKCVQYCYQCPACLI
jgi:phosphotransferase system IIA component